MITENYPMRVLADLGRVRVVCACENERRIDVAVKHRDMPVQAFARALRCGACGRKGGKALIAMMPAHRAEAPRPVSLFDHPAAHRAPRRKASMIERGFALADRQRTDAIKALYPDIEERIAAEERFQKNAKLIRALLGWSNEVFEED